MPITQKGFAAAVQAALPNAEVMWTIEPEFITNKSCALTATDKCNPSKTFTMAMPNGIGQEPLDDVVLDFVRFYERESDCNE